MHLGRDLRKSWRMGQRCEETALSLETKMLAGTKGNGGPSWSFPTNGERWRSESQLLRRVMRGQRSVMRGQRSAGLSEWKCATRPARHPSRSPGGTTETRLEPPSLGVRGLQLNWEWTAAAALCTMPPAQPWPPRCPSLVEAGTFSISPSLPSCVIQSDLWLTFVLQIR